MPNIPGVNLLNLALSVIQQQTVIYYKFDERTVNDVGQYQSSFENGVEIVGSFQPVPRNLYRTYGLDFQKEYYTFYTSNDLLDLQRDVSGDQIEFMGKRYQCESNNDWFKLDGWKGVLCVNI